MKTNTKCEGRTRKLRYNRRASFGAVALLLLLPLISRGGGVVTVCTEADLRTAMVGGGLVTFACDGTILLANTITNETDITFDARGHQVTISGGPGVRVFQINTNVTFTVVNLTIANASTQGGSAILNLGGTVNLIGVLFRSNSASWSSNSEGGGAIFNSGGIVNATNCSFADNLAYGRDPISGGAIRNSGTMTLDLCTFTGNHAVVERGEASGGAIFNEGTLLVDRTTLSGNTATGYSGESGRNGDSMNVNGGNGGDGAGARGAAICSYGSLRITRSTLVSNVVSGGSGGAGGSGWQFMMEYGYNGGNAGSGKSGLGGALFTRGAASLVNCTIAFNTGTGGAGGYGGGGGSGGHWAGKGGVGGSGGSGFGGVDGTCDLTNCTVAFNVGKAGAGGAGGTGGWGPGGAPGTNGTSGVAWGGTACSAPANTLIVSNNPAGGDSFPNPKLGLLANNGGPTLTMALLPGSPAIDAGITSLAPATDQRGVARPFGAAADIGAYEFNLPWLRISRAPSGGVNIVMAGTNGQVCVLQSSTTSSDWQCVATNQVGPDGTVLFQINCSTSEAQRYYKAVMP